MSEEDAGMRYIDGKLYSVIQRFQELGNFESNREAQRALAEKLEQLPFGQLLPEPGEKVEKEEKEPFLKV